MGAQLKRFKDPVHGYITIPAPVCHALVDTAIFQRLRHVEQTSMRPLYPGARHDRFIHSLGVYHLGCKAVQRIQEVFEEQGILPSQWTRFKTTFEIACLLHDCGHAPFSHTCEKYYNHTDKVQAGTDKHRANLWLLEKCKEDPRFRDDFSRLEKYPADHESFSAALMLECFERQIEELGAIPILAARMITGCRYDDPREDEHRLANCLISLLHGNAIDVDKLDYLLRDTWASGVKNTAIDIDRLIHGLGIKNKDGKFALYHAKSSLSVVQSVVDARNYLHDWVFTHHTVKYYAELLDCSLQKLADTLTRGNSDQFWTRVFSKDSFKSPVAIADGVSMYMPTDGDIISLLKTRMTADSMVEELLSHKPTRVTLWKTRAEFKRLGIDDEKNTKIRREGIPEKLSEYCDAEGWGHYDAAEFLVVDATSAHLQLSAGAIMIDMGNTDGLLPYTTVMGIQEKQTGHTYRAFFVYVPSGISSYKQQLIERVRQCFE